MSSNPWEFARIIPQGEEAEKALDQVCEDPKLSQHHRSFIHVKRKQRSEESESDQGVSERRASPKAEYWAGYYSLSLEDSEPSRTTPGWLLGRGSSNTGEDTRGVDILLIRPKARNHGIATVHARIQFHPWSGVLMLVGLHTERPIVYSVHDESENILLADGQSHVLYQKRNLFKLGSLHYELVFCDHSSAQYPLFLEKRNLLLYGPEERWPHLQLSAIPRSQDVKRGAVITHGTIGHGKFGRVSPAVHAGTGEPLAIKHHQPASKQEMVAIIQEFTVGKSFSGSLGLLDLARIWCEHDYKEPCPQIPQSVFTSSSLAYSDFSRVKWELIGTNAAMELFYGPLQGLATLHSRGYMHRDVSAKNLLVTSYQPLRAVLGDYGKAIKAASDRSQYIGPAYCRAPEVDGFRRYDNKIDVWSMGILLLQVLVPPLSRQNNEPFGHWHRRTEENLTNSLNGQGWPAGAARMILGMLRLDPATRSSAAQALIDMPPPADDKT